MEILNRFAKPWYLYRPGQIFYRLKRIFFPSKEKSKEIKLPWGTCLEINIHESIGKSLWETGIYEISTTETLYRLIDNGDLVLDIGANIGYMTSVMGTRAGKEGEVIAFEPHPFLFKNLSKNLLRFQELPTFAKTTLLQIALSDKEGESNLNCPEDFDGNQGIASLCNRLNVLETIRVNTARLDDLLEKRIVSVAKIDVEGSEPLVFAGAKDSLKNQRIKHLIFEDHEGPSSPASNFLVQNGYSIFQLGWSLNGPVLAGCNEKIVCRKYEAPNYLATSEPDFVISRFAKKGWQCLGR